MSIKGKQGLHPLMDRRIKLRWMKSNVYFCLFWDFDVATVTTYIAAFSICPMHSKSYSNILANNTCLSYKLGLSMPNRHFLKLSCLYFFIMLINICTFNYSTFEWTYIVSKENTTAVIQGMNILIISRSNNMLMTPHACTCQIRTL